LFKKIKLEIITVEKRLKICVWVFKNPFVTIGLFYFKTKKLEIIIVEKRLKICVW